MADIAAGDVTHTVGQRFWQPGLGYKNEITLAFGDGALTYGAAKVPLTKAKMGCPTVLLDFVISDEANADGLMYKFDKTNERIRIYEGDYAQAGDAPLAELDAADTPAAATLKGWAYGY